jgi:hypothetical protein
VHGDVAEAAGLLEVVGYERVGGGLGLHPRLDEVAPPGAGGGLVGVPHAAVDALADQDALADVGFQEASGAPERTG